MKKLFAMLMVVLLITACSQGGNAPQNTGSSQKAPKVDQAESKDSGHTDVEVNVSDVHLDSYEASTTGNWEAMFTPVEVAGRGNDMEKFDLTPTPEELEAMKKEPAYGRPFVYYMSSWCTSGPRVANHLGFFEEAGLKAEGLRGTSQTEALGTGQVDVGVEHIATMLVPCTNGVDLTFVGGAHVGCKSLYVLKDSEYTSTKDLIGTTISVPDGIGNSDYNITSMLLDADGIDPRKDVELTPVLADACVAAMERGEISAALLSDSFAYGLVKDGKLKCIRSLLDEDFAWLNCCVIGMNSTYVKENPVMSKKIVQAIQKAHHIMRNDPEKTTALLLELDLQSGDPDMLEMLNHSLQFGVEDSMTEKGLRHIAERYIDLGLITATDNVDEVMARAWSPVLDN